MPGVLSSPGSGLNTPGVYARHMLVVDVYNVLHAAHRVEPGLGGLRLFELADLISQSRHRATPGVLVCDGSGGRHGGSISRASMDARLRVLFAGAGKDADSAIEQLLDQEHHLRRSKRCLVVSSDRRVQLAARGVQADWISSQDFLHQIVGDIRRTAARASAEPVVARSDHEGLDAAGVAYWFAEFGLGEPGAGETPARETKKEPEVAKPAADETLRAVKPRERGDEPKSSRGVAGGGAKPVPPATRGKGATGPNAELDDEALLRLAAREWGERINLDDLNMERWLERFPPPKNARGKERR